MEPSTADAFVAALARPQEIEATEEVESAAKRLWAPILSTDDRTSEAAFEFSRFFGRIGFFRKYKPYGVKFAAPFGYSIFALKPAMGFSVQLHRIAKVEAFHILSAPPGAFVLLGDQAQWAEHGSGLIKAWGTPAMTNSELVFQPAPGDVFVIAELGIVHSIVGCTLEEFATTSNDAVERLFDQNAGMSTALPRRQASVAAALRPYGGVVPRRRVATSRRGWTTKEISRDEARLVDLPEKGLGGWHIPLAPGSEAHLVAGPNAVVTIACVAGAARVRFSAGTLALGLGDSLPIAPGEEVVLEASSDHCRLAACSVATDLALADLRAQSNVQR